MQLMTKSDAAVVVAAIRRLSGVDASRGPDDDRLFEAVKAFVGAFDYWYIRVMREAVLEYRKLIVMRINPIVRRLECEGMDVEQTAQRFVEDYNNRNFVTAGGWAIEALALAGRPDVRKSSIAGIDIERYDAVTGVYHLYVLKSGLVTRNSDIIAALKRNARQAERQLLRTRHVKSVRVNYAIAAGRTTSNFEDGIWRPSSGEFWSEMFDLPEGDALALMLAIAAEAGRLVRRDAAEHIAALKLVVGDHIAERDDLASVDWDFIPRRTLNKAPTWGLEDDDRHKRAMEALRISGYVVQPRSPRVRPKGDNHPGAAR
jgi:hypothetical protein